MSVPMMRMMTNHELQAELDKVEKELPYPVEVLRRLRDAEDLTYEEQDILDKYEALVWVLGDE